MSYIFLFFLTEWPELDKVILVFLRKVDKSTGKPEKPSWQYYRGLQLSSSHSTNIIDAVYDVWMTKKACWCWDGNVLRETMRFRDFFTIIKAFLKHCNRKTFTTIV